MFFDHGQPKKQWIAYDNGSYEPVDPQGDLRKKPRDYRRMDWWVEDKTPDWRPDAYANTRRGKKAEQELGGIGTFFAKPTDEHGNPLDPGQILKVLPGDGSSMPSPGSKKSASAGAKSVQPQHANTGHASVRLGGPEDGHVTLLGGGKDADALAGKTHLQPVGRLAIEEQRLHNADTGVEHRTEQEILRERTKKGRTGSQLDHEKKDAEYKKAREWLTKHGQGYARDETRGRSSIVQDTQYLANLDYSSLSAEELNRALRKAAQLADLAPVSDLGSPHAGLAADLAAYRATKKEIQAADVAPWRKRFASGLNTVGIVGAVPGGTIIDGIIYESIGALINEQNKRKGWETWKKQSPDETYGR